MKTKNEVTYYSVIKKLSSFIKSKELDQVEASSLLCATGLSLDLSEKSLFLIFETISTLPTEKVKTLLSNKVVQDFFYQYNVICGQYYNYHVIDNSFEDTLQEENLQTIYHIVFINKLSEVFLLAHNSSLKVNKYFSDTTEEVVDDLEHNHTFYLPMFMNCRFNVLSDEDWLGGENRVKKFDHLFQGEAFGRFVEELTVSVFNSFYDELEPDGISKEVRGKYYNRIALDVEFEFSYFDDDIKDRINELKETITLLSTQYDTFVESQKDMIKDIRTKFDKIFTHCEFLSDGLTEEAVLDIYKEFSDVKDFTDKNVINEAMSYLDK